jgi:phytoene dehydrogenase-like protein
MTNPLDDALRKLDDRARQDAADRERRAADAKVRREKFAGLVSDFLRRMNRAANPGCTHSLKVSRFNRENTWNLHYAYGDYKGGILLAPDGRVVCEQRDKRGYASFSMVPYSEVSDDWLYLNQDFGHLAQRMAEELRKHNVT